MNHHIKIIKDCIHGHIEIPSLCINFMDVPEFQRLRRVRQLGVAHNVYPSAVHSRFEHCLGVMHLSGRMVDQLHNYVKIPNRTKELIQLGGLYHDIGHFAYSHLFDKFLQRVSIDDSIDPIFKLKHHEDRSLFFLRQVNNRLQLLTETEVIFVENIIKGIIPDNTQFPFLYQIVCNAECGIDVDKMDYISRDSMHCGLPGFQTDYIIFNSILDTNKYLAFRQKARRDIYDMFEARQRMYENVYHHHTTLKIGKLNYCILKRLGLKLFQYGQYTDDYNIETLARNSEETSDLMCQIDTRQFNHICHHCEQYICDIKYIPSGSINQARFI